MELIPVQLLTNHGDEKPNLEIPNRVSMGR